MAINSNAKDIIEIIKKYGLHPTDAYIHSKRKYKVINRKGFKKIQAQERIFIKFILEYTNGIDSCVVKAIGNKHGAIEHQSRETFGECSPRNSAFIYPHSVAQSRAEGRMILELADLYEKGFITEDEIDEKFHIDKIALERKQTSQAAVDETLKAMGLTTKYEKEKTTPKVQAIKADTSSQTNKQKKRRRT